jgi:ComF family protein
VSRLPVCAACLAEMRPISGGLCAVCGERLFSPYAFVGEDGDALCGLCRRAAPPFAKAAAYGSYEGGLRDLIHLLKYQQVRPAANVLGRMLGEAIVSLETWFGEDGVTIVPVPLHKSKFRQRGFNQAELTARIAMKLLPSRGYYALSADVLECVRETQSQTGLTRHQRRENLRGAFQVHQPSQVAGREILLVDDVLTTGTTVSECARILKRAGAAEVWVATVARTLKADVQRMRLEPEIEMDRTMAAHG